MSPYSVALRGVHNVFHMLLLCDWHSNVVHANMPSIQIDREAECKVGLIKGHCVHNGEV